MAETEGYRFDNGLWFNGAEFEARTVYVVDGVFAAETPGLQTIDLSGSYVIPPYCEGHNHNLGVGKHEERGQRYLRAGVFYVKIQNDAPFFSHQEKAHFAESDTLDVAYAHGGITGPGGHPVELLEGIRRGGGYPGLESLEDHAYFEIADAAELERKWPLLVADRPDFIKVFLQYSEEYEARKADPAFFGNRGFDPKLLPRVVELARKEGLRVSVHTTTAHDFHVAAEAGVFEIAHLPGYMSPQLISEEDARIAAEKGIVVTTTARLARSISGKKENFPAIQEAQKANLQRLKDAGVKLAIGSDSWADSSHLELAYLRSLDVFSIPELLKMWTVNCPRSVFPERRIGALAPGYEASFLALGGNPLKDFGATRNIAMRVKQGRILEQPQ
ncbi:MAG: amidohydrolase family protein [Sphingomonadales bacterium]